MLDLAGIDQEETRLENLRLIAFWLFAGFVPLACLGNLMLWRFVSHRVATGTAK
jgi:hypothetical protein